MNKLTFGVCEPSVDYADRRAAYAVILGEAETVAVVPGPASRYWLPGGGCLSGETAEEGVSREVREELGRVVRLIGQVGEAIQFFHAANESCNYRMRAIFFHAELTDELATKAEHNICWLPIRQTRSAFFHECHAWAVDQAVRGRMTDDEQRVT